MVQPSTEDTQYYLMAAFIVIYHLENKQIIIIIINVMNLGPLFSLPYVWLPIPTVLGFYFISVLGIGQSDYGNMDQHFLMTSDQGKTSCQMPACLGSLIP